MKRVTKKLTQKRLEKIYRRLVRDSKNPVYVDGGGVPVFVHSHVTDKDRTRIAKLFA